jgi:hypothetical protein
MKLHHAAALALMGWYLMMPPFNQTTQRIVTDAPISKWVNARAMNDPKEGGFRTLARCEDFRTHIVNFFGHQNRAFRHSPANRITYQQMQLGKCVARPNPDLDSD